MIERHGALWVAPEGQPTYEEYDPRLERIALVCKRSDGFYEAWLFKKGPAGGLYCLPFWEPINDKAILPSEAQAMAHLEKLKGNAP
jgi:hypothetical protein